MDYQQLKHFGEIYTGKVSPGIMMSLFTSLPKELGFIGTPKFMLKMQNREAYWKKQSLTSVTERNITNTELLDSVKYSLAFYNALEAVCGKKKALDAYLKLTTPLGVRMDEEFFPTAQDFLRCPDPWEAFKRYMFEFFSVSMREGVFRFEVLDDTDTDLHFHVTDCAWYAIWKEAGHPEVMGASSAVEMLFYPALCGAMGCSIKRDEGWICRGDSVCDWHFYHSEV